MGAIATYKAKNIVLEFIAFSVKLFGLRNGKFPIAFLSSLSSV